MDAVEKKIALGRIASWPKDWQRDLTRMEACELEVVGLLVALMDARPDGETR